MPFKTRTSVDPAVQAYIAGQVQLSNLQKLAEGQSYYSGPKKNLVEDEQRTRKWPTRKLDKTVGKRDQFGGATKVKHEQEETMKKVMPYLWKAHQND